MPLGGAILLRAAASLLCTALAAPLSGQEGAPATPAPQPFRAAEIPAAGEELAALLRDIETVLAVAGGFERARDSLPAAIAVVDAQLELLDAEMAQHGSARGIADLEVEWLQNRSDIGALQRTIDARWQQLQRRYDSLREQDARWRATLDGARNEETTPALVERVRRALADIEGARGDLDEAITDVLDLQEQAAGAQANVSAVLRRLDRLAGESRARLWQPDAPPLWSAWPQKVGLLSQLRREYAHAAAQLYTFMRRYAWLVATQLAAFIALAVALSRLRRRLPADSTVAAPLLSRPFALALLLALLLGAGLYDQAPTAATDLMFLMSIVPLLRVAPPLASEALRGPLSLVCLLFAVFLLATPVDASGAAARLVVIVLSAVAGLLFVRGLRRRPPRRLVRAWLRFAIGMMVLSIAAMTFGWTALGTLVSDATLRSGFFGLASMIAARAIGSLLPLLPRSKVARWVRHLPRHGDLVVQRTTRGAHWTLGALWVWVTCSAFDILGPLRDGLSAVLSWNVGVGAMTVTLGGVLGVVAIVAATVLLSRYVRFLVDEEVLGRLALSVGEKSAVNTLVHYTFLFVGGLLAASAAGLNATQLTVVAGALGVGIGFGLQAIVSNFVSGLILVFERPISVGDRIQLGTQLGIVRRIGIRASVVRTYEGAEIILPNSELISQQVVNWTLTDEIRRVEVPVGVAYGTDTSKVLEVLARVGAADPLVVDLPRPDVLFTGFGDSSLNFVLRCWVRMVDSLEAISSLGLALERELRAAGIEIPFPQHDVRLRGGAQKPTEPGEA